METQDQNGRSPLRLALLQRNDKIIKVLLIYGVKVSKGTFMMLALNGNPEIVKIMLDLWANIEHFGCLIIVAALGKLEVLKLLIKYGADVNESTYCTPLHKAVEYNKGEIVSELLKNGANPNLQDTNGNTPIHEASRQPEAMKLLLDEGINLNLEIRNQLGDTAFECNLRKACKDAAKIMLHFNHQNR